MELRDGTLDDVQFIIELAAQSAGASFWTRADYERALLQSDPKRHVVIAQNQGNMVGFIVACVLGLEWEIENLAVSSTSQRQGIGIALVQRIADMARTSAGEAVYLEVRESNQAARKLYEKFGFSRSGERRAYYSDPVENAVLYTLSIK